MTTSDDRPGGKRRAALASLLNALVPDPTVHVCTGGPIFDQARLILGMPSEDLRQIGQARALFGLQEILFGVEPGRYYSCPSPDCAKVFARTDPHLHGEAPVCLCGLPLRPFNKVDDLLRPDLEFNLVLDEGNAPQAFTCGTAVAPGAIDDAFLGHCHTAYGDSALDEATHAIYHYFDADHGRLASPAYLACAGAVLRDRKGDLRYLAAVYAPLLQSAARAANGRFVCINRSGTWIHQINLMLGLDVICTVGPLVYLGLKEVTLQLLVFQKLDPATLADLFRLLARLPR